MKVSKSCGTNAGCFSNSKFYFYGNSEWNSNYLSFLQGEKAQMYILADGSSIAFFIFSGMTHTIKVDIDGPNKGKNREGFDNFTFRIDSQGDLVPRNETDMTGNFVQQGDDYSVTMWVIQNDNLDYLKCAAELNWRTKTSCK